MEVPELAIHIREDAVHKRGECAEARLPRTDSGSHCGQSNLQCHVGGKRDKELKKLGFLIPHSPGPQLCLIYRECLCFEPLLMAPVVFLEAYAGYPPY